MIKLEIDGERHEVEKGQRLVLAIKDAGVNIGHRCGGNGKCTTCRVTISKGAPERMTKVEQEVLSQNGLLGEVRLSCQITCDNDISVEAGILLENEPKWNDTGPMPEKNITPEPEWVTYP